jgi:hypothetical protein
VIIFVSKYRSFEAGMNIVLSTHECGKENKIIRNNETGEQEVKDQGEEEEECGKGNAIIRNNETGEQEVKDQGEEEEDAVRLQKGGRTGRRRRKRQKVESENENIETNITEECKIESHEAEENEDTTQKNREELARIYATFTQGNEKRIEKRKMKCLREAGGDVIIFSHDRNRNEGDAENILTKINDNIDGSRSSTHHIIDDLSKIAVSSTISCMDCNLTSMELDLERPSKESSNSCEATDHQFAEG